MASGRKRIRYRPVKKQKKESGALRYSPVYTGCPAVELAIQRLYQADDSQRENRFWALIKGLNYALEVQTQVLVPVQLSPGGPRGQFSWAQDPIPPEKSKGLAYWVLTTPKGQKMLPVFTRPEEADGNPATLGLPMAQLPLQQVMEETLGREDLTGLVVNPWGRSAALDKSILRGLLYAGGTDDTPGEAETRQGRLLAYQGRWEEAEPLFAAAAAANYPEGIRRLADCYDAGHGIPRDRRKALSLWKKAAAQGDVLAQIALGDRYGAGTARTPGDPGRALMAYRKARSMAEMEMDITSWPVVCLRMAQTEARGTDPDQMARLLAEAIHGLSILAGEEQDEAVERELHTAIHEMRGYIREIYAGTAGLQEMMQQLEEQVMNIESLHLS